jgi:arylsulfatase A-like enzyme
MKRICSITTAFLLFVFTFVQAQEKAPVQSASKPNILFILADDLGYADLGCQGSKEIRTPHIDSLAKTGIRLTDAYVSAPQCGPSRAGIMTGINQARFGYLDNNEHAGLPDQETLPLMPELMKSAGYRTGLIGKWHIGQGTEYLIQNRAKNHMPLLPVDRIDCAEPWMRGFDEGMFIVGGGGYYFPFKKPFSNHPRSHYYTFNNAEKDPEEIRLGEDAYSTDFFTDAALTFIKESKDEPFFLYLSYTAPHSPLQAKPEDIAANSHIQDKNRRIFAGMMTCLDNNIGRVLDLLDEEGLRENTLIVFMSDNGGPTGIGTGKNTSRNDPFTGKKGDVHEGGIRVPCIMSWTGVFPAGTIYSKAASSLDLLPTFAAVAGAKLNTNVQYDGLNLIPYLKANPSINTPPHEILYWRWREKKALRYGDYKWLDAVNDYGAQPNYGLFDLSKSSKENSETILNEPERLNELEHIYTKYWKDHSKELIPEN